VRFRYDNGQLNSYYEIIEYVRPSSENYIVLESLNQLKDNNNYKSIHVITLNDNHRIVMGRGHDSDLRINDISVSRTHSCLTLNNKKILLKDYKSKFGTLILVQNEIEVSDKLNNIDLL
jgi:pSer/pThr/pTyr-binding forkhead associated (FHA) protein